MILADIRLRLFLSPYFSISVAMHYLKTYPDSIGISHYLCWRMKHMPPEEVEFYWPQIWYVYFIREWCRRTQAGIFGSREATGWNGGSERAGYGMDADFISRVVWEESNGDVWLEGSNDLEWRQRKRRIRNGC
jgi:hypothetical protein